MGTIDFNSYVRLNQVSNFTVTCNVNKIIWIEGVVDLLITANQSGIIICELIDSNGGKYFTPVTRSITLAGNNQSQNLRLTFNPLFTTFPGRYNINLRISGLFIYNEDFEVILGLGYILLLLIVSIFGIGIILILKKKVEVISKKPTSTIYETERTELVEVPSKKIACPECKKLIEEGLVFCSKCGVRIPEFLRYNPN